MISVVIPTYKNRVQLYRNIAHNLPFLAQCEVVIVNDFPGESVREGLPKGDITLIENKMNLGFAGAADTGIRAANNRYVMLLNSDVLLKDDSYLKAYTRIRDDHSLFAVSFAQEEKNGHVVGKNEIYFENGFVHHRRARDLKEGENAWAEGGACIIDKKKYLGLDGFDRIYSPYYWEDVDLSYRAWKSGYRILFDPAVTVEHHHESTIGKYFSRETIDTIAYRNQMLFIWKNITEKPLRDAHIRSVIRMLPGMVFKDRAFVKGFMRALARLPAARAKQRTYPIADRQILEKFI
jgi:GT2 family glycosyltransferase